MYDIILIFIVIVIILCTSCLTNIQHQDVSIQIEGTMYEKAVDIVTDYSLKSTDHNDKMILIYLSTFHLFDMNFPYQAIKRLDDTLIPYPYIPNEIAYPSGNMHHNLQKAIITHITQQIAGSERQLYHDRDKDRMVIDVYLSNLFTSIGVKR